MRQPPPPGQLGRSPVVDVVGGPKEEEREVQLAREILAAAAQIGAGVTDPEEPVSRIQQAATELIKMHEQPTEAEGLPV